MKRRILSLFLALVMVMSVGVFTPNTAYAVNTPSGWAVSAVEEAIQLGLATEDLLDDFGATTTRLEFCRAAINLLRKCGYDVDSVEPKMFSDTNDRDVGKAAALGITNGTDSEKNLFSPNNTLTREQAVTLLNNVLNVIGKKTQTQTVAWTDAESISGWAQQAASDIYNCGVISGTDTEKPVFSPKALYTHEQSIVTLLRMWKYISPFNDTYDPEGHDPAKLRQSQNRIFLAEGVDIVYSLPGINVLTNINESRREYTFEKIDESISKLNPGDKFIIYPCDNAPDGLTVIVESINITDSRAVIKGAPVSFGDFVEAIDLAQIVPLTDDMIVGYGAGVSLAAQTNIYGLAANANTKSIIPLASVPIVERLNTSASLSIEPLELEVDVPINDTFKVTGSISVSPTLKADIDLHEGWFDIPTGVDYFELSLNNEIESTLRLEALYEKDVVDMASIYRVQDGTFKQKYANYKMTKAKCDAYKQKLFTAAFPIPSAPGLKATVTWYLKVSVTGQISIEAVYTQNNMLGIKLENGQWSPINTNHSDISVKGAADASLYAGVGIDIGLSYIGVIAASVAPEIGLELKASTEFNAELLEFGDEDEEENDHGCVLCIDGDINLKLSLNANVEAIGFGNVLDAELLRKTTKLGDFYYTLGGTAHSAQFGWSECPYAGETERLEIVGTWVGSYYATQGETALTLTVYKDNTALFEFYNLPGRSNAKSGKYLMSVSYNESTGEYSLIGKEWIEQPSGYVFVDLYGYITGSSFSGDVRYSAGRYTFNLLKI